MPKKNVLSKWIEKRFFKFKIYKKNKKKLNKLFMFHYFFFLAISSPRKRHFFFSVCYHFHLDDVDDGTDFRVGMEMKFGVAGERVRF